MPKSFLSELATQPESNASAYCQANALCYMCSVGGLYDIDDFIRSNIHKFPRDGDLVTVSEILGDVTRTKRRPQTQGPLDNQYIEAMAIAERLGLGKASAVLADLYR